MLYASLDYVNVAAVGAPALEYGVSPDVPKQISVCEQAGRLLSSFWERRADVGWLQSR